MPISLKVRDIGASKYKSKKFVLVLLYIASLSCKNSKVYTYIKYKLYFVKGLKANILIGNNMLYIISFLINFANISIYIQSYGDDIIVSTKYHS